MSPAIEKLIWTAVALAAAGAAQWPPVAGAQQFLMLAAGTIFGKAWMQSVDDKHAARARQSSVPPAGQP